MDKKETEITHITKKDKLRCPECEAEIMEEVLFYGSIFSRKKKVIYYCPLCHFENKKIFRLTNKQFNEESI